MQAIEVFFRGEETPTFTISEKVLGNSGGVAYPVRQFANANACGVAGAGEVMVDLVGGGGLEYGLAVTCEPLTAERVDALCRDRFRHQLGCP